MYKQANTRKYEVVVHKLTSEVVTQWGPPKQDSWKDIDPYSSLEDVGDMSPGEVEPPPQNQSETDINITSNYGLREHKTTRKESH